MTPGRPAGRSAAATAGTFAAGGTLATVSAPAAIAASTSRLMMRPEGPVPTMVANGIPAASAIRRATGLIRMPPPEEDAAGAAETAGLGRRCGRRHRLGGRFRTAAGCRRCWCRSCGFEVRRILTLLGQQCDHRADVDLLAWLHINGGDGAVVVNGKLHGGLVGLHISDNVS